MTKRWVNLDGRDLLLEEVPMPAVREQLDKLPEQSAIKSKARRTWTAKWKIPAAPKPPGERKPMLTASADVVSAWPGYVLDYSLVNATVTNLTFQGDTTYYVNGGVNLYGTTTIEGGTVIKFNPPVDGFLYQNNGSIVCRTGPYRPAVFTSKNDNSVGEIIAGSTGNPTYTNDWNYYLAVDGIGQVDLRHIRMAYGYCGVTAMNCPVALTDAQFLHFAWPVYLVNAGTNYFRNILMHDTPNSFDLYHSHASVEHLTANQAGTFGINDGGATMTLTNSLLANISYLGNISLTTNAVVVTSGTNLFQTALGGLHYLPTNSAYRNAGTTNLNADLKVRLARTTTEAPVVFTNLTFTQPANYPVRASRDTGAPDLGYHYDPLDYVFGGCHFNTNITFNAGVAVGWFRTSSGFQHAGHGIHLDDRQNVTFDGRLEAPNWFVRCTTVQEEDRTAGYGAGGITGWADQYSEDISLSPQILATFTRFSMLANDGGHARDDWGYLILRATHSEFYNGAVAGYLTSFYYTNCLMHRLRGGIAEGFPGNEVFLRSVTRVGSALDLAPSNTAIPISVKDTAFDGTALVSGGEGVHDHGNNAYLTGADQLDPAGDYNVTVDSFDWESGPLGGFYLPSSSSLIDVGGRYAADVSNGDLGLYHFTTQVSQAKEEFSVLDMGYHYVAVDGSGAPLNADGDAIPDYLEDANGDGYYAYPETDWNDPDTIY